jgi:hypothetical protein
MAKNTNYEARAAAKPTALHEAFAEWLFIQTGVKVDLKSVQLACSMRMDFQASPENQADLAKRKANAAAAKKASAARKKAKLEAELAKLKGAKVEAETPVAEQSEGDKAYEAAFEKSRALGNDHAEAADAGKRARDLVEKAEIEAPVAPIDPVKLTVVYGEGDEPEIHKFGCADLKKMTRAKGFRKETATLSSYTALTHLIYPDQAAEDFDGCYLAFNMKPCCPSLDD